MPIYLNSAQQPVISVVPDYQPIIIPAIELIGSGNTTTEYVSGSTWIIYSPTGTTTGDYVSRSQFNEYTGATAIVLNDVQQDVLNLNGETQTLSQQILEISGATSGLTGTYVEISTFTGYTAATSQDIQNAISCCTGLTEQFVSYTGQTDNTLQGLSQDILNISGDTYNISQQILEISGATSGLTGTYVPLSTFTGYTATTTQSIEDAMSCCTGNTQDIEYHYSQFTGFTDYVNTLIVPAITGLSQQVLEISGDTYNLSQQILEISGITSGLTGTYVEISTFTGYTASTNQNIDNISEQILEISGITSGLTGTYLTIDSFTGYTDVTAPQTYAPLSHVHNQYSLSGHNHSYLGLTDQLSFVPSGATQITQIGKNVIIYTEISSGGTSGSTYWSSIMGKPSWLSPSTIDDFEAAHSHDQYSLTGHTHATLYAPLSHTQTISTITGLQTALDGKSATGHTHATLYAPLSHSHSQYSLTGHTHTGVYAPLSHTHTIANVTGLQTALDGKSSTGHTHATLYAPLSHTQAISTITGLQTALDGKSSTGHTHATLYAPLSHTHTIANVTGLQTALDGKSSTGHTHATLYAPLSHTQAISTITGLQTALDGKSSTGHTHTGVYAPVSHTHTLANISDVTSTAAQVNYLNTTTSNVQTQLNAKLATTAYAAGIVSPDTRTIAPTYSGLTTVGISSDFKTTAILGFSDGTYAGVMSYKPFSNSSGGYAHQLAFTQNGNLWHRIATGQNTWGTWGKLMKTTDPQERVYANSNVTLDASYNGKVLWVNGTRTITLPATGITAGFWCDVYNYSTGYQTIVLASTGQTLQCPNNFNKLYKIGNRGRIQYIDPNRWTFSPQQADGLTASRAVVTNASQELIAHATVTDTELGYLDGVTSSIQTQLNAKTNKYKTISSKTTTYTVTAADLDTILECSGTFTVTFPNGLTNGFRCDVINVGTGVITLAATTTLYSKSSYKKLASQWCGASVYQRSTNVFVAVGDLTA